MTGLTTFRVWETAMIISHQTGAGLHGGEFSSRCCDTAILFCTNRVATLLVDTHLVRNLWAFAAHHCSGSRLYLYDQGRELAPCQKRRDCILNFMAHMIEKRSFESSGHK
jgi:hypothetical protein